MSTLTTLIPPVKPVEAQQQAGPIPSGDRAARNWEYATHNSWSTNYSPQTEINKDNVKYLELKWVFPNPDASLFRQKGVAGLGGLTEGSISPPLVVDGVVYHTTNLRNVYAFDGVSGKIKWTSLWDLDYTKNGEDQTARGLKGVCDGASLGSGHIHATNYINGQLYSAAQGGYLNAIDANTGKEVWRLGNICADIEGNISQWPGAQGRAGTCSGAGYAPVVYRKENILLVGMCGSDSNNGGRSFIDGYDLNVNPPKRLWRTYTVPPFAGDPEWAIKACDNVNGNGWYFDYPLWYKDPTKMAVNCKDVPRENVINDWGVPRFWGNSPSVFWGQWAVDEETGLFYAGGGNAGASGNNNATFWTPGPTLFASATMALDAKTGKMVWWNQHMVRDMNEADNSWNVVLANIAGKKTIIKHNTMGLIWAMDAATGKPTWVWEPSILRSRVDSDGVVRGRSACSPRPGADPATQDGFWRSIMSKYDMQEKKWINYPSTGAWCWFPVRPGESDIAFDSDKNTILVQIGLGSDRAYKNTKCDIPADPCRTVVNIPVPTANVTVYAVDATTGKEKWSYFIPGSSVRGGTMVSGGVVYVNSNTGYYYLLDEATGKLLNKIFFGSTVVTQATIGKTAQGKSIVLMMTGGRDIRSLTMAPFGSTPGALFAYGLPDKVPQPADVAREALNEVPKEQLKDVLKDVPKEALSQVAPAVETVSPISYGIVGVGVVLIVIAGVLFTRRKKA
ncbi:MAG TPA: PQQ-binding-like beta-propeller repeat protein [Nitrososphaerales archaeon]